MLKSILSSVTLFLVFIVSASAQIYNPVAWDYKAVKTSPTTFDVIFEATIDDGWYIYSQYLEGDDGPNPTYFEYDKGAYKANGKNEECDYNRKEVFDKLFNMDLVKYAKKAYFRQTFDVEDASKPVTGFLEFMTCDDTKCIPPKQVDFSIDLSKSLDAKAINYSVSSLCDGQVKFVVAAPAESQDKKKNERTVRNPDVKSTNSTALEERKPAKDQSLIKTEKAANESSISSISIATDNRDADNSQIFSPVTWTPSAYKNDAGDVVVQFDASIDDKWYIYSKDITSDDGPARTQLTFEKSDGYKTAGEPTEKAAESVTEFDPNFDLELIKLKKKVTVSQAINVTDPSKPIVGFLEYMTCTNDRCLTPTFVDFEVDPKTLKIRSGDDLLDQSEIETNGGDIDVLEKMFGLSYTSLQDPVGDCVETIEQTNSLWQIFILGFLGGLIALLTPCVFPMIPLTVSFFTKGSEIKGKGLFNAIFYGFSIFAVYVLISVPFHLLDSVNPNILNDISTNMWLNIVFFVIFIFFAFSFFGYFDLTLPSSVTNKISAAEGIGGVLGIFFMALTLALVSFSCTGPILGSLLAGSLSSDGGAMQLTSGFAGFGLALGLPFGIFAAFPALMNSLPRSGGWLNTVKVVLGFIELALAFKFLSNADLVKQWGILKIEPFLIIWIIVFVGLALYLIGKIKFPHDSPIKKLGPVRIGLAALSIAFAVYLASGFRYSERTGSYQPLSLLSGLAPPVCYSFVHKCKCPQGLDCYKDLQEGLAYARSVNKPVLLDFTGHACVNCRKMEEHVWPEPEVYTFLRDDYVLISLYVDEKIPLPEDEQVILPMRSGGTQKMRYTGNRWAYLQTEYFNINAQPYYVLMTPDGQLLNNPVPYTPDKLEYAKFLECGLSTYRQLKK